MLREVIIKIELERIDTQERLIVEALLDSEAMRLVISLEFARKQGFKLKKIEQLLWNALNTNIFFSFEFLFLFLFSDIAVT